MISWYPNGLELSDFQKQQELFPDLMLLPWREDN
jgi:hypothetical protein